MKPYCPIRFPKGEPDSNIENDAQKIIEMSDFSKYGEVPVGKKTKSQEVEGLGIVNIEVPTQTTPPVSMASLCTCFDLCQHKKFAWDEERRGVKRQERPDVFDVLRRAKTRKSSHPSQ